MTEEYAGLTGTILVAPRRERARPLSRTEEPWVSSSGLRGFSHRLRDWYYRHSTITVVTRDSVWPCRSGSILHSRPPARRHPSAPALGASSPAPARSIASCE